MPPVSGGVIHSLPHPAFGPMTHIIRAANPGDADALSAVSARTFALACSDGTPLHDIDAYIATELAGERFLEHMADPSKTIFVAEEQGVCGYSMLCQETTPEELRAWHSLELRRLYVVPERHGSGIADSLMERAVSLAKERQSECLWLGVSGNNHRAIRFYSKHGFSIAGTFHFPLGQIIYEGLLLSRTMDPDNSFKQMPLRVGTTATPP